MPGHGGVVGVGGLARLEEDVRVLRRAADHRMVGAERARPVRARRARRRAARAGRRRRAARSRSPRARCGSRRRSGGTGSRARSVAAVATAAKSCASCTSEEQSIAKPVPRAAITSLWSPKIESACVASARAATCMTNGVSSPAILNMSGQHQQQPLRRGEGRRQRAGLERAVHRAGGAALRLHLDHDGDVAPEVRRGPSPTTRRRARPSPTPA